MEVLESLLFKHVLIGDGVQLDAFEAGYTFGAHCM
jgi:hypothetical protein